MAFDEAVSVVPEPNAVVVKLIVGAVSSPSFMVIVIDWLPEAVALTGLDRSIIKVSSHSSIASSFIGIIMFDVVWPLAIWIVPDASVVRSASSPVIAAVELEVFIVQVNCATPTSEAWAPEPSTLPSCDKATGIVITPVASFSSKARLYLYAFVFF